MESKIKITKYKIYVRIDKTWMMKNEFYHKSNAIEYYETLITKGYDVELIEVKTVSKTLAREIRNKQENI